MTKNAPSTKGEKQESGQQFKRSWWWKAYFFLIIIVIVLGSIGTLITPGTGIIEYVNIVLTLVGLVGLFGYVYLKRILFPKFWLVFLVMDVTFALIYSFITSVDLKENMSSSEYYITMAITVLLSLPIYYAIYIYSKKDYFIWSKA